MFQKNGPFLDTCRFFVDGAVICVRFETVVQQIGNDWWKESIFLFFSWKGE